MKRTLYLKFVLTYFIFGFFGFIVVATFTSNMTLEHMKRERADALYKEALLIRDEAGKVHECVIQNYLK